MVREAQTRVSVVESSDETSAAHGGCGSAEKTRGSYFLFGWRGRALDLFGVRPGGSTQDGW